VRPNRQRHGNGVYVDGGYEYNGQWENDKMHGQGNMFYEIKNLTKSHDVFKINSCI